MKTNLGELNLGNPISKSPDQAAARIREELKYVDCIMLIVAPDKGTGMG
jgi:hypothetical protein